MQQRRRWMIILADCNLPGDEGYSLPRSLKNTQLTNTEAAMGTLKLVHLV